MKNGICPKCKSDKVVPEINIDQKTPFPITNSLTVENAKGLNPKVVKAYVCGECGYTELYVQKPAGLWEGYKKSGA